MKRTIVFEIMNKLKSKPKLRRKVKAFAFAGLLGFLLIGGLTVWAGISAIGYVASSVNQAIQLPDALPKIQSASCWDKAQTLMSVHPWLQRPPLENLATLKVACFEQKPDEGSSI